MFEFMVIFQYSHSPAISWRNGLEHIIISFKMMQEDGEWSEVVYKRKIFTSSGANGKSDSQPVSQPLAEQPPCLPAS